MEVIVKFYVLTCLGIVYTSAEHICNEKHQRIVKVKENENVTLKCNFIENGSVRWYKENNITISSSPSLFITNVTRRHQGNYCCESRKMNTIIRESVKLIVKYKPVIYSGLPTTRHANVGSTVTLFCLADGNPVPHYTWSKNNRALAGVESVQNRSNVMVIKINKSSDFASYKCTARNDLGFNVYHVRVLPPKSGVDAEELDNKPRTEDGNVGTVVAISCFLGLTVFLVIALAFSWVKIMKFRKLQSGESRRSNYATPEYDTDSTQLENTEVAVTTVVTTNVKSPQPSPKPARMPSRQTHIAESTKPTGPGDYSNITYDGEQMEYLEMGGAAEITVSNKPKSWAAKLPSASGNSSEGLKDTGPGNYANITYRNEQVAYNKTDGESVIGKPKIKPKPGVNRDVRKTEELIVYENEILSRPNSRPKRKKQTDKGKNSSSNIQDTKKEKKKHSPAEKIHSHAEAAKHVKKSSRVKENTSKRTESPKDDNNSALYTDLLEIKLAKSGTDSYVNLPGNNTDNYMPLAPDILNYIDRFHNDRH